MTFVIILLQYFLKGKLMSNQNNSRHYYVSNENMSDIKQSIEEYSMNFEKQSGVHGNSRSEIAEMISGSHQITQSRAAVKQKANAQQPPIIKQEIGFHQEPVAQAEHNKKPVNLGQKVFKIIRERYFQVMKITTDDPQVLYDFYLGQKKHLQSIKPIKDQDIEKQMPSMQRKLIVKKQFQKMLTYYPEDIYYSLVCECQKQKKDRELQTKLQYFNRGAQANQDKMNKKTENEIKNIVEKLYNPKGIQTTKERFLTPEEIKRIERTKFGRNLSQHFQNTNRQKPSPANIETVEKLYNFWQNLFERQQFGLEWPEDTAKKAIEMYMYEQIEDLMNYANRKLGFKCGKAISLQKAYEQNLDKLQNIYIPMNSFQEYVKVYNEIQRKKQQSHMSEAQKAEKRQIQARKKKQVKQFGRPVSATPISILSKPKTHNQPIENLAEKYPKDKLIRTLITQEQLKKPRHALEYGVHDIEQQIKLKQWVKIDPKAKGTYEDMINRELVKTFSNMEFSNVQHTDQVNSLLAEDNLQKNEVWKELGPILQEAMLVKAHENDWFRDCILRYLERVSGQNLKLETNQVIMNKLFIHLNSLDESQKSNEFQKLETLIITSENIADKAKKIQLLAKDPNSKAQVEKQRKLLYSMLQQKAVEYLKMRIRKTNDKFTLRNYLKQLFQQCMKEYKNYVIKNFNVVEGDKQCPKLLKYQFFRIVKQINPITLQKQRVQKNHVWVPPKQSPQNFNYKTYNTFSEFYMKDRNIIVAEPERQGYKNTIWGRKKAKDRQNLMMTYDDAKQCIFQPRLSKKY